MAKVHGYWKLKIVLLQDCINFIAEKNIQMKTQILESIEEVDEAVAALEKGNDGGVRYVIDIPKTLS